MYNNKFKGVKIVKKVAFVCIHNSCRSQMAEGYAKELGKNVIDVYSAGTEKYKEVKPLAVSVMNEDGIDMSEHYPKLLSEIPNDIDILITMGCGVECPFIPCTQREDWGLDDPSGGTIEDFRRTRNIIKQKVEELIKRVHNNQL
jgi:glutathione/glutaredoxin type arsenate reductase